MPYEPKKLGFFTAFFGLIIAPMETSHSLLTEERPRHGMTMLAVLFLTIFTPIAIQLRFHKRHLYQTEAIASLILVLLLTLTFFVILEKLLLKFVGVRVKFATLLSAMCYCLAPLMLTIWAMYLLNYIASGSLSYLTVVLNGYAAKDDRFLTYVPWILTLGGLMTYLELTFILKTLGNMYIINAFIVALVSIIPFYMSLIGAVLIADLIRPGSVEIFLQILYAPNSLLNV